MEGMKVDRQGVSDEELVRLCWDSHKEAFDKLIDRYYRLIFDFVEARVRDFHAAEDIVQEIFFRAYMELGRCREPSKFAGWLFMIAKDRCYKWIRKHRKHFHVSIEGLKEGSLSDIRTEQTGDTQMRLDIQDAISSLPDEQQLILTLKYKEGLSCEEIATILARPVGTITGWLSRAYEFL
jgi:RNA polymerase sigma-70 factor (ECF subfamily)